MENLLIHCAIVGAICAVYVIAILACQKWVWKSARVPMYVGILIGCMVLFASCSGNPDDHTGENWLLLIGLLLCWLKG